MNQLLDLRRIFVAIIALGLFVMAARSVTDPDVWWHLRTGQLILQSHAVFHKDPYSFTHAGQPWINHEWLSDVLMFELYRAGGTGALTLAFAVIVAAAFLLVFARTPGKPYLAALVTVWGALASAPSWGARPQVISLLLASLFLWLLERSQKHVGLLWWTIPLTALWVNLHAEFALGIGLIALFLLGIVLDGVFGFEGWTALAPRLRWLALALAGCITVVPLNPYGTQMYWYPWHTLSSHVIVNYIEEWSSPDFHRLMYLPFFLMVLALALVAISPLRLKARELLLLAVMLYAGLHSVRHIPIFALVAAPILAASLEAWLQKRQIHLPVRVSNPGIAKLLLNVILLAAFAGFVVFRVRFVIQGQARAEAKAFPTQAVAFILHDRPAEPLLNSYDWGGYLIWKLYPQYRVFVDGRTDLYEGGGFLDDMASIYNLQGQWQAKFDSWRIRTVFLPPNAPLIAALRSHPGWKQIYADSQAVVLTRIN